MWGGKVQTHRRVDNNSRIKETLLVLEMLRLGLQ